MTAFVIFNPNSANGRTGRDWQEIETTLERVFPLLSFFVTSAPGQGAHMVRDALRDGHMEIIAVGGDGTINEALNGFFDRGMPVAPDAVFNFVHNGNTSRLCRRFGIVPGWQAGIAHLAQARIRKTDLGRVSCLSTDGAPVSRHFLGEASFGLAASMSRAMGRARIARLFGHPFAAWLHGRAARLRWHETRVRLRAGQNDGPNGSKYDEIAGISSVVVAPHDGMLDVTVRDGSRARTADHIRMLRAPRLTAAPTLDTHGPVDVDCDGESTGVLPATFDICPAAINLRV